MNNGTIMTKPKEKQYEMLEETLKKAQETLKEVKYRGNYPTLYDFLNWSLRNSENIITDISYINTIDNKVILARKLFEIYLSVKVTKDNTKCNLSKDKLVPKFIQSSNKKIDTKKICSDVGIEKDFYSFYSIFAHPYSYSKLRKEECLDIETNPMLYYINDYEYQINQLNQTFLIYMVYDMIVDINYIINRLLKQSNSCEIKNLVINREMVYNDAFKSLEKLNKKILKKQK